MEKVYSAIDLKSFYASVECVERGLDPLNVNLVVADESRTEKTICLAVSPALKAYGIPGRARLFEVVQRVREVNIERLQKAPGRHFTGKSYNKDELDNDPSLELDYIVATPRMAYYMDYSTAIYDIYLKYVAHEDMHVYSVDEVFIDLTSYLKTYQMSARELTMTMIKEVYDQTGITATAGIGTNMYLCKIAMDIVAKHMPADENGVRMAYLDEKLYRQELWSHRPITDFWRVGRGISKKLASYGMYTMGDVARCSVGKDDDFYNEDLLYKLFGVNAELLIDHAWGWEPTTIDLIKNYKPTTNSLSSGQVLKCPYTTDKAKLIVKEMTDLLVLDMVDKRLVTDQIVLTIGYDIENLTNPDIAKDYRGPVVADHYGRLVPKHAHGTSTLKGHTSSTETIMEAVDKLYDSIINPKLLVRRINVSANHLIDESKVQKKEDYVQLDLFTDYEAENERRAKEEEKQRKERALQEAILSVKKRYGKNSLLKGMNLEEGATTIERNSEIGGHRA